MVSPSIVAGDHCWDILIDEGLNRRHYVAHSPPTSFLPSFFPATENVRFIENAIRELPLEPQFMGVQGKKASWAQQHV